jgi:hypothetical protein
MNISYERWRKVWVCEGCSHTGDILDQYPCRKCGHPDARSTSARLVITTEWRPRRFWFPKRVVRSHWQYHDDMKEALS